MILDPNSIRIMTFNIRCKNEIDGTNSWDNRKKLLCELIDFHGPDVLCLQEVLKEQLEYILKMLPQYYYYGVGRDDGKDSGEFVPILICKDKFRMIEKGHFWLSEKPEQVASISWDASITRVAIWVKLYDIRQQKTFYVFNTHYDHFGVIAREQSSLLMAKKISEIADKNPTLLTGDFNEDQTSKMYENLILNGLKDTGNIKNVNSYGGYISFNDFKAIEGFYNKIYKKNMKVYNEMKSIDYIFMKNNIKVIKHGILTDNIDGFYPSDHMPKICDFLIE